MQGFSSSLSVQIGLKGNVVGAYLWQIRDQDTLLFTTPYQRQQYYSMSGDNIFPKVIIVDQDNQFTPNPYEDLSRKDLGVWSGKSTIVERTQPLFQPLRKIRNKAYHPKSIVKSPKFPSKTWYYGGLSDGEMADMEENTLEGLRHFAETCDYLEAIDMFVDLDSDLGFFCERLLEAIRSDYGRSISVPLWMVEQSDARSTAANSTNILDPTLLAQEKAKTLISLTNPLAFARFTEYTDVLIPLTADCVTVTDVLADLQVPFGLATTFSFRSGTPGISTREWIDCCTGRRTFPVCGFESMCFPSMSKEGQSDIESFFQNSGDGTSTRNRHCVPINPMMVRRSPILASSTTSNLAFTNFTIFRGWNDENLGSKLFKQVRSGSYYMSHCLSYQAPIDGNLSKFHEDSTFHYSVAAASGVYADTTIGDYIQHLENVWSQGSFKVREQLSKVSIEKDDAQQVSETLHSLSERYNET